MALNTSKCNHMPKLGFKGLIQTPIVLITLCNCLTPLHFKGLSVTRDNQ